jgi:hypothetical protein
MQKEITSNITRLSLHDSSFETIFREDQNLELTFDWSKLENFQEAKIEEGIIIGKTKMYLTGINSEQCKIYRENDNSKFTLISLPDDIISKMNVIIKNNIDDNSKTAVIAGNYLENEKYCWIEWSFKFDTCKVFWNSHITYTDWKKGKTPMD